MASRRIKLITAAALVVGAGGYFLYSVFALQGQGTLAQAPLNNQTQIPPAFIMAVDDSNSMTFERLFPGGDGRMQWTGSSFFSGPGTFFDVGDNCGSVDCYVYLFPHDGYNSSYNPGVAIPPLDVFGFARSPTYNAGYFNPAVTYAPWANADGTSWAPAIPAATRADPRTGGTFARANAVVYNLPDALGRRVNADNGFSVLAGMTIPAGTVYRTPSTATVCGSTSATRLPGTNGSWTALATTTTVNQNCSLQISYFPAVYYLPEAVPAPAGYNPANINRPVVANACGPGCNLRRYQIKPGNYPSGADYTREMQNFANWHQYHHNRILAMVGAMTDSLLDVNNMRVGYFTINNRVAVAMRDMPADRPALYTSITSLQAGRLALGSGGGTPNRDAVAHLGEQFRRTDAGAPIELACQKNGGMLFTDGFTNSDTGPTTYGNADGALAAPFADNYANTIADIAARYYLSSAQGGLAPLRTGGAFPAGNVPIPDACSVSPVSGRLDCQTDLHMNFYGVTLGAQGAIYDVNAAATADPFANPPNWNAIGDPRSSNGGPTVDEIWHASLNARGEYINAKTPADITTAMRRVLASVTAGSSPAGSIALTGARIGAGSLTVSPFYEARNSGTDWYSRLNAESVATNPLTRVATFTPVWEASARLPAAAGRAIWFGNSAGLVQTFTAGNVGSLNNLCDNLRPGMSRCTGAQLAALNGGTLTLTQTVDYLRGDQSLEAGGKLRFRTTRLGDIVNSTPVLSAPKDDYGYRSLPAPYGGTVYGDYLTTGKGGRRPMVYAGANDGMLHGFDGRSDASGGIERFAYIPRSVLGHTGNLLFPYVPADGSDQKFQHRYYVDGPLVVSDAYYGGGWKTALVGTTGAGARGAFALNVSGVSGSSGSFSAADRLWEISDLNTALLAAVRDNIGHVLGKPVIVPVKTGSGTGPVAWRAIFGNGYNSVSGKAVLFMVDINAGAPNITMIEAVEAGAGVPPGSNGLGNIVVTDRWGRAADNTLTSRLRDGFADTVYAADQKGAIWKFDIRNATPANQTVPLFTTLKYTTGPETGYRQPILGGLAAAAGPGGGVLVYFGTGSFSFNGDGLDTTTQSLYAVLDSNLGTPTAALTRTNLVTQTIGVTLGGIRTTSSNLPGPGTKGWHLDLPAGERFVGYPRIESGILFMPTYDASATSDCGADGVNWLYGLNALTGAAGLSNARIGSPTGAPGGTGTGAMALNTGGSAPVKDVVVLTAPRMTPLGPAATPLELAAALAAQCSMVVYVAGAPPLYLPRACGRQSWRQIQ